jgi:tetratricopeptide (TPR) repeat protein
MVPEACLNNVPARRPSGARLDHAVQGTWANLKTGLALSCVVLCFPGTLQAETVTSTSQGAVMSGPTHITDEQDRMGSGHLSPVAEARSHANALYAEAMLLPEDVASDQQTALDLFRQIVALDPSFTEAQIKLANLLLQTGQLDQALAQLQTAAGAHPDSVPIEVALGYTQRLRGENDDALRLCTRALRHDSNQSVAMRVLLEIASDQNDLAGGVLHIEDILREGGSSVAASAWLNLARLYLEIARAERFPPSSEVILRTRLPILREAADKPDSDVATLTLLSDTYRDLGRKIEALSTLRRAAEIEPSDFDIALHSADLESDLGQTADAIKDYEKAYALNPGLPGLREMLGGLYLDAQRYEDASRLFEEAVSDSPQSPALLIDLGIAYEGAHHPDKAQACFQQVFNSVTCPPEAYLKLAVFQMEHEEVKQAASTLVAAQSHFPESARIRFYEAIQHRYEKNYPAALACLAEVRTLATGAEAGALDPGYYLECALTLNLAGQKENLANVLQEGLTNSRTIPS